MFSSQFVYTSLIIFCVELCMCQRKIFGGVLFKSDKRYVVYLLRSVQSDKEYNGWICGGTLISESQVLTSAACLLDVSNVYVVAGLERYVNARDTATNECLKAQKRKVMKFCYPTAYKFSYSKPAQWTKLDIAVATVDKSYNFTDRSYRLTCSYVPLALQINYDSFYEEPGTLVQAYGWGHKSKLRVPGDLTERNSQVLNVAYMEIMDIAACKKQFRGIDDMEQLIDKFMVCAQGSMFTSFDEFPSVDGSRLLNCRRILGDGFLDPDCIDYNFRRKAVSVTAKSKKQKNSFRSQNNVTLTKRSGICENDHGGPLVTRIGSQEVIIGVAVTSLYNENSECVEPSLFMSTYRIKDVLECLITNDKEERLRCAAFVRSKGYEISELDVHWVKDSDELKEEKKIKLKQKIDLIKNVYPQAYLNQKRIGKLKTDRLHGNDKLTEFVAKRPIWPGNSRKEREGKENKMNPIAYEIFQHRHQRTIGP